MGVNLGGGDIGVAEHGLNRAEVGAVHEKVGGERVAEGVGSDVFGDAGGFGVVVDDTLDGAGGEPSEVPAGIDGVEVVRVVEKESGQAVISNREIVFGGFSGGFADENWTVFFAFAANNELATF